jgi:hypothetical protein
MFVSYTKFGTWTFPRNLQKSQEASPKPFKEPFRDHPKNKLTFDPILTPK